MVSDCHKHGWLHLACPSTAGLVPHGDAGWTPCACAGSVPRFQGISAGLAWSWQLCGKTLRWFWAPELLTSKHKQWVPKQSWELSNSKKQITSAIHRKRSEKVVGADLPSLWAGKQAAFSKAPSRLYSQVAEGILGVSEELVAAVVAGITSQPLPKPQVSARKGASSSNSPSWSMALQESEKENQNLLIGKPSWKPRFQACHLLTSLS